MVHEIPGSGIICQGLLSDVDEEELQDQVEANDPPQITVTYDIKINSVKEVLLADGVPLSVQIMRGEQKSKIPKKELKNSTVIFGTKVQMKTTLKKQPNKLRYDRKDLVMSLMRMDTKEDLGSAKINLANYINCEQRKKFSQELQESPFPEATIEFAVTATKSDSKSRANTAKAALP